MTTQTGLRGKGIPLELRAKLMPVAQRVFWWGTPQEWVDDALRFGAQVMTYGNLEDVRVTLSLLGDKFFLDVLRAPPAGVFDPKSWTFWHAYYRLPLPHLPTRKL